MEKDSGGGSVTALGVAEAHQSMGLVSVVSVLYTVLSTVSACEASHIYRLHLSQNCVLMSCS